MSHSYLTNRRTPLVCLSDTDATKRTYDDAQGRFVKDSSKRNPEQPEAGASEIADARNRRISDHGSRQPQIPVCSLPFPERLNHTK